MTTFEDLIAFVDRKEVEIREVLRRKAVSDRQRWQRRSIYKLPVSITNLNKNAYMPQVVSFGPYHRYNEDLKAMEEHKDRALEYFLVRSKKTLESCIEFLSPVKEGLKEAYNPLDADLMLDTDEFLIIMIRDACFMLEIFQAWKGMFADYAENDPIFSEKGRLYVMPHIKRDMLLLENQLPMKVLEMLLRFKEGLPPVGREDDSVSLSTNKLVYEFLLPDGSNRRAPPSDCLHILHMRRKMLLGGDDLPRFIRQTPASYGIIEMSAGKLSHAGIDIKPSKSSCLNDVRFEDAILSLPRILVDDTIEPLLLNQMAFERFHVEAGNEVTSFVFFMRKVILDARDIRLLRSKEIIQNDIGSDAAAVQLFNSLAKDVRLDATSPLSRVCRDIDDYCKKPWTKYRAKIIDIFVVVAHSDSPWAFPSVLAAILLFILTITQTVCAIMEFHKQK